MYDCLVCFVTGKILDSEANIWVFASPPEQLEGATYQPIRVAGRPQEPDRWHSLQLHLLLSRIFASR